jgi:hypothetical protein
MNDRIDELLWKIAGAAGDESDKRVKNVIDAVVFQQSICTGSELLALTETASAREELQGKLSQEAGKKFWRLPTNFVSAMRTAVEESRLAFSGFPYAPPGTKHRILFSAPHSLPLCREGHRPHLPEAYTSDLAREFAQTVGGAFLTWTLQEKRRALRHYKSSAKGEPDPTNKDPNFTHRRALSESPWTRNLREIRNIFGQGPSLHVDLHGCKDPGISGGAHLVVGLRAMEFANRGNDAVLLREYLRKVFKVALRGWSVNLQPQKQLTGALEDDFRTSSQQSLTDEGGAWTHSVQIEMSRQLRTHLVRDKEHRALVAQAIMWAWILTSGCGEAARITHMMKRWISQCEALSTSTYPTKNDSATAAPSDPTEVPAECDANEEKAELDEKAGVATANDEASPSPYDGLWGLN